MMLVLRHACLPFVIRAANCLILLNVLLSTAVHVICFQKTYPFLDQVIAAQEFPRLLDECSRQGLLAAVLGQNHLAHGCQHPVGAVVQVRVKLTLLVEVEAWLLVS